MNWVKIISSTTPSFSAANRAKGSIKLDSHYLPTSTIPTLNVTWHRLKDHRPFDHSGRFYGTPRDSLIWKLLPRLDTLFAPCVRYEEWSIPRRDANDLTMIWLVPWVCSDLTLRVYLGLTTTLTLFPPSAIRSSEKACICFKFKVITYPLVLSLWLFALRYYTD